MKRLSICVTLALFSILVREVGAGITVVADDPFEDGDFISASGGDALGLVWLEGKRGVSLVDGEAGLGSGKALHFAVPQGFGTLFANFPAVPLTAGGDTLTVEFDYRLPTGLPDISSGLRMGFYDSRSTQRLTDTNYGAAPSDDPGYGFGTNAGSSGRRGTQCFREAAGNDILGGPAPAGTQSMGQGGPGVPVDGDKHHLRFVVKRTEDGGLEFTVSADDGELATLSEPADQVMTFHFDEFALGFAGRDNQGEITIDNFKITAETQDPLESMASKAPPVPDPVFRTWTNQQGRKIEASLVGAEPKTGKVTLRMKDGREFVLAVRTLSREDVEFVTKAAAAESSTGTPGGWVVQYPEAWKKAEAKLEGGRERMRALRPGHPRLLMLAEEWPELKKLTESDPLAKTLYAAVFEAGTQFLSASPLEHVLPDGKRLLLTSRAFVSQMVCLGMLHRLDGDPKWSKRAIEEMLNICRFEDWNPAHFLDVGEMAHGMAIGYDWFYDQLSDAQRAEVRKAILEKAFAPALEVYARPGGWHRGPHLNNWNHVCNGGLIIAALAIGDEERRESQQILEEALSSLQPAMNLYLPDGAWEEGTGYWEYATNYVITCAEALRTATGSDAGISSAPALDRAAEFMQHASGATRKTFNFADAGPSSWATPAFLWMGRRFQRPGYSSLYKSYHQQSGASSRNLWFGPAHGLIWFDRGCGTTEWSQAPCDRVFRRIEMVSLRSSWELAAWSISAKGGDNRFSHGDLDLGTFVLDALGERWAMDLGADSYGLPGYFGPERFTHYRKSSAGQNTLTWDNENQELDGTGFVETFESTPERSWAVLNLSKGYRSARQVRRGIALTRGASPTILIQDEIDRPGNGTVVWAMHTPAIPRCEGNKAILELGGRQLTISILEPAGAGFQVEEVNLQPPSLPTPNTRKLLVNVPAAKGNLTIAVIVSGGGKETPVEGGVVTPLAKWGGRPVAR